MMRLCQKKPLQILDRSLTAVPFFASVVADNNQLDGSLPSQLQALSNLQMVFLEGNIFGEGVNQAFCQDASTYQYFYAECNDISECVCCTHCCNENGHMCQRTKVVTQAPQMAPFEPADKEALDDDLPEESVGS